MEYKKVKKEITPKNAIPYRKVSKPFRFQFVIPGEGITIEEDANGICYISSEGGMSVGDLVSGDNIEFTHTDDGKLVISSVNSVANISAGENVTITIDPDTGASVISSIIGGETNEHYQGVFDTTDDLIEADPEPEVGDYGLIKSLVITNGETSWTGQYKYCFFINGAWTVVDQMLTFTKDTNLLQQYYSVGGSSPVIYLHEIAKTGNFWDLNNIPIVATPEVTVDGTTVTVTCATEGAEIWYTTDGSMPHVNGTKYTGQITASGATTFRFVGIKNGMINSLEAVASVDYELKGPGIDLDWHTGEVSMTNSNVDGNDDPLGAIYYTTDGSEPTSASTLYDGPFVITSNTTFRAVVYNDADGKYSPVTIRSYSKLVTAGRSLGGNSIIGTALYFFRVKTPELDYQYGEVHYTTDGSMPDFSSPLMEENLTFQYYDGAVVVKCIGFKEGYIPSSVDSYTVGADKPVSPPVYFDSNTNTVTLVDSTYIQAVSGVEYGKITNLYPDVVFYPVTSGYPANIRSRVYYTLDGSTPTDQSTLYTGPFQVTGNVTVKAVVVAYGQYYSDVATLAIVQFQEPQFSLDSNSGWVTLTNPNGSGTIYYTTDGSTPTAESTQYSSPLVLTNNTTVKAVVIADTGSSPVAERTYTKASAPTINNANPNINYNLNLLTGEYTVTMQTTQQGGITRYTSADDGYTPADPTYAANSYTSPLTVAFYDEYTFKARTFASGYLPSDVTEMTFGVSEVHPVVISYDSDEETVNFTRQWITANIPLQTNNNTPTLGCRVYYTLDGSTPDNTSTLWDGNPVSVDPGTTVKAVLVCYGQYSSEVSTLKVPGGIEYLYFEAAQANSTVSLISTLETAPNLEYSTDGEDWQEWQHTTADGTHTFDTITLGAIGDRVYFRGDNPNGLANYDSALSSTYVLTGAINAGGNVMSLLDSTMELTEVPDNGLVELFLSVGETPHPLLTTPDMSTITAIGYGGCSGMYYGCESLTAAADMPLLTAIGDVGCSDMYDNCKSLTAAADMPLLTAIGEGGCDRIYMGCTSLTTAADMPLLAAIGDGGCDFMYEGCTFNMSDDGTTLNFDFPTPPVTAGETTYATAYDVAEWMGNTNGF